MITTIEQNNLEELISNYNRVDFGIVKRNIIRLIDKSAYCNNNQALAEILGLNVHTIYGYRQPQRKLNVGFESALRLCNVLGVSINELMIKNN